MASVSADDGSFDDILRRVAATADLRFQGTARYRVRRCLGEGGFGVVYEADDLRSGSSVALKVLRTFPDDLPSAVQALKNEFRSLADVVHPNLVGLHELESDGGHWFITKDLVRGVDLLRYVRGGRVAETAPTEPRLDDDSAVVKSGTLGTAPSLARLEHVFAQLVDGIGAIHARGLLHRDLKPHNVLVEPSGRVVILDFGLARDARADRSVDGRIAGTPAYMAPEQTAGHESEASDWYALGVMLFEALTGALPFSGTIMEVIAAKVAQRPPAPSSLVSGIPAELDALTVALLDPDPERRPKEADLRAAFVIEARAPSRRATERTFVGRGTALAELETAFLEMMRGAPARLLIEGPAGIGKTELVERFAGALKADGRAVVLSGRCFECESVPFKTVDGVIDALARHLARLPALDAVAILPRDVHLLARLFPALSAVPALRKIPRRAEEWPDPLELRQRAFAALKELLGRLGDSAPLVVFIDDLQWGDLDGARLLAHLISAPAPPQMLLIATCRSEETSPEAERALAVIRAAGNTRTMTLGALGASDAEALARALLERSGQRAELAPRIAAEAAGHPLFLHELVLAAEGRAATSAPSRTLVDMIWERIGCLDAAARSLLETIALAGQPLSAELCFAAAAVVDEGPACVRQLRSEKLVRTQRDGAGSLLACYHDRVREAVTARTPPPRSRDVHLRLAEALTSADDDPERIANHYDAAGDGERAGEYAVRAARAAMRALAFDRAARLYAMALERIGADDPRTPELREEHADALRNAGYLVEAGRAYLDAAALREGGAAVHLWSRAADSLVAGGARDEGLSALDLAVKAVGLELPASQGAGLRGAAWRYFKLRLRGMKIPKAARAPSPEELMRLDVCECASRALEYADFARALPFVADHLLFALDTGDRIRIARAMPAVAAVEGTIVSERSGKARMRVALELAQELDDPYALAEVHKFIGVSASMMGNFSRGRESFDASIDVIRSRCAGLARDQQFCLFLAILCTQLLGELRELRRRADEAMEDTISRGGRYFLSSIRALGLVPVLLAADDPGGAFEQVNTMEVDTSVPFHAIHRCTANGWSAIYAGQPARGVEMWRSAWPALEQSGAFRPPTMGVESGRSFAACLLASSPDRRTLREARALAKWIAKSRARHGEPSARAILASCAILEGDSDRARRELVRALAGFEACEVRLMEHASRYCLGMLIGGEEGAASVAQAREFFEREGVVDVHRFASSLVPGFDARPRLLPA